MISVQGYDMYDEDGNLFLEEVPCHAMEIVDFTEDGKPIVSSWGNRYTLDINGEAGGLEELDNHIYVACVNYEDNAYDIFEDPKVTYM